MQNELCSERIAQMKFFGELLVLLDSEMKTPQMYGWFHLLFFALSIILGVWLCLKFKKPDDKTVKRIIFIITTITIVLEIYKQINYTFTYNGEEILSDFQWYAFPFQFCSMPMYVGLLASIVKKGKVYDALCAFLATFAVFAGVCVMLYPAQVFIGTIGINIQTMICHGSMISIGIFLLGSGYVKSEHKTIFSAIPVFACCVIGAMVMNEIAYRSGLLESETFNMFFISPYCEPSLPVYSIVQGVVPFPWCLFIYVGVFSLAAYVMLLISMLAYRIAKKK